MFCKVNITLFLRLLNMILRHGVGGSVVGWLVGRVGKWSVFWWSVDLIKPLQFYNICSLITYFQIKRFACVLSEKSLICISRECKPLSRLGDLVVSHYANLFVHEKQSDLFNSTFFYTFRGEIFLKKKIGKFKE